MDLSSSGHPRILFGPGHARTSARHCGLYLKHGYGQHLRDADIFQISDMLIDLFSNCNYTAENCIFCRLFFRRHYPFNTITHCSSDVRDRK